MRKNHRRTAVLLAGAAVLSLTGPTATALPAGEPARLLTNPRQTVTLLTGDIVEVGKQQQVTPRPGPGRRGISFTTRLVGGHLYVVPSDADELLRQGKLDRRLFDVTELLANGYDDARSKTVKVIVQYGASAGQTRPLRSLNATPAAIAKDDAGVFWAGITQSKGTDRQLSAGVEKVWLDGNRRVSLDKSVPQIGAPQAWQAGFTGAGVKVAVLDTGIDPAHPDLAGQITAAKNFTDDGAADLVGHGTHVASTIAGTGKASGGKYKGVAPGAKLLDGKVCQWGCLESAILAGMEWAAVEQQADIVNLSLGGPDSPEVDPLEAAINRLSASTGALFVVAAGNQPHCGPRYGVSSPATADAALAVGAVDMADQLAGFSCTGPRTGDHAIKPDITAPGVDIAAARAAGTDAGAPIDENYTRLSGTSMATPHVVGAAALLAQQHPEWKPGRLKSTLMASSKANPDQTVFQQGLGRVDVGAATRQTVITEQPSVSFPVQLWPHSDDKPVDKVVTYQNLGTADVELALAVTGQDGKQSSTFKVSTSSVRVTAGGTAQVTITSNTAHDGPDGFHTGRLTATGTGVHLTTALSVEKESESFDLTVKHVDRQGQPIQPERTVVASIDDPPLWKTADEATTVVRLPKGRYTLNSYISMDDPQGERDRAFLAMPELLLDRAKTVIVDAARTKPIKVTVPESDATPIMIAVRFEYRGIASLGYYTSDSFRGLATAQLGPAVAGRDFASSLSTQWCKARPEQGCADDSPFAYHLRWYEKGRLYTGFDKTVRKQDLATLKTQFADTAGKGIGETRYTALPVEDIPTNPDVFGNYLALPSNVTQYFQPEGIRWFTQFREFEQNSETGDLVTRTEFGMSPRVFRAGTTTDERWNFGVFGPGFPATDRRPFDPVPKPWAARTGDHMSIGLPLFTDQSGHPGFSKTDEARTTLTRAGKVVAESAAPGVLEADLPAGDAPYRLEAVAKRGSLGGVSSEASAAWTFRSRSTDGQIALPLSAIRFAPALDLQNRAEAGPAWVPVTVEGQPGSAAKSPSSLTVTMSYDDGKTWKPATLRPTGAGKWLAKVSPPPGAFVSFQATSTDRAGNKVEQTTLRAYGVK